MVPFLAPQQVSKRLHSQFSLFALVYFRVAERKHYIECLSAEASRLKRAILYHNHTMFLPLSTKPQVYSGIKIRLSHSIVISVINLQNMYYNVNAVCYGPVIYVVIFLGMSFVKLVRLKTFIGFALTVIVR